MNPYLNHYQNTQITTASPEQILIMLYDGAIRFVHQAKQAMEAGDLEKRTLFINKATAIVSEFRATLDHEIGGEIAENLESLYGFMISQMALANAGNSVEKLGPVISILTDLRSAWIEAAEIVKKEKHAPAKATA